MSPDKRSLHLRVVICHTVEHQQGGRPSSISNMTYRQVYIIYVVVCVAVSTGNTNKLTDDAITEQLEVLKAQIISEVNTMITQRLDNVMADLRQALQADLKAQLKEDILDEIRRMFPAKMDADWSGVANQGRCDRPCQNGDDFELFTSTFPTSSPTTTNPTTSEQPKMAPALLVVDSDRKSFRFVDLKTAKVHRSGIGRRNVVDVTYDPKLQDIYYITSDSIYKTSLVTKKEIKAWSCSGEGKYLAVDSVNRVLYFIQHHNNVGDDICSIDITHGADTTADCFIVSHNGSDRKRKFNVQGVNGVRAPLRGLLVDGIRGRLYTWALFQRQQSLTVIALQNNTRSVEKTITERFLDDNQLLALDENSGEVFGNNLMEIQRRLPSSVTYDFLEQLPLDLTIHDGIMYIAYYTENDLDALGLNGQRKRLRRMHKTSQRTVRSLCVVY